MGYIEKNLYNDRKYGSNGKSQGCFDIIYDMSKKYNVDIEEVLIGISDVPPYDTSCLVYVRTTNSSLEEYFRKDLQPNGRWVCWNMLEEVETDNTDLIGTIDYKKQVEYVKRGEKKSIDSNKWNANPRIDST